MYRALCVLSRLSAFPPYVKGTLFPAPCPAPLQCALQQSSIALNRQANTFQPVPSELSVVQRWRTDTCLPFSSKLYSVVTGKEPTLWSCPKSSCHGAFPDTRNPLEPSRVQNSPFLRGTRGVVLLSSWVWKDVNSWALELGISCTYSNPVVTGGQKHTQSYGIKHKPTTFKNPKVNAILERVHQVLGQMLCTTEIDKAYSVTSNEVDVFLDIAEWAICSTYHTVLISLTGNYVSMGRKIVLFGRYVRDLHVGIVQ